jgi:predicted Zn finger-like uncharacterized protein
MAPQVTQCPKCHTSFRVTEAQLNIANGAVRCGSCLHIFNAPDFWLEAPQPTTTDQTVINKAATAPPEQSLELDSLDDESSAQQSLESIFEDGDFDDDYLDQLGKQLLDDDPDTELDDALDAQPETAEPTEYLSESALPSPQQSDARDDNDEDPLNIDDFLFDDDPIIDDSLMTGDPRTQSIINIEDDLHDIDIESSSEGDKESSSEFSSHFLELDQQESKASAIFKELDDMGDGDSEDQDSWAKKLLEEAERESESEPQSALASKAERQRAAEEPEDQFENLFDSLEEDEPTTDPLDPELLDILGDTDQPHSIAEDEFILSGDSTRQAENSPLAKNALLANIEPEAVEFATSGTGNNWIRRATIAGVVAALLLLALQYLMFNFDRLARDTSFRPLLASSCGVLGCTLPAIDDVSLVRSSNLMIRSHPNTQQALVVDAIMTNHADFKQPFPVMELQFMDLDGHIIAGRSFQPREYLAGELLGRQTMPIKQPVHIALEIVDPGELAVNYQLRFHSSKGR